MKSLQKTSYHDVASMNACKPIDVQCSSLETSKDDDEVDSQMGIAEGTHVPDEEHEYFNEA